MKIPFLLAMLATLITGIISITNNATTNKTCIRMIIAMVSFYIIGVIVCNTLKSIIEEQNKQKLEAEEKLREEEKLKEEQNLEKQNAEKLKQEEHLGNNLDLVTDNKLDEGFSPLDLSQAIRTKIIE